MLRQPSLKNCALFLSAILLTGCVSAHKKAAATSRSRSASAVYRADDLPSVTSDQKIMQELTGKIDQAAISKEQLRKQPLSVQHFYAGQKAAEQKNYIVAIKHYNTVIKNYPRSAQVKPALLAKAKVYNEMGLTEPAQLNMRLAQIKKVNVKSQTAKNQDSQKTTK
ncbi:MAG: outer membrane protein assembly factor BamD [Bdellovibrio sp.]|nr:outer membrane protein assembly factor BamD [Bdellovibrio sp.]